MKNRKVVNLRRLKPLLFFFLRCRNLEIIKSDWLSSVRATITHLSPMRLIMLYLTMLMVGDIMRVGHGFTTT